MGIGNGKREIGQNKPKMTDQDREDKFNQEKI
jgi:hypothetical protein